MSQYNLLRNGLLAVLTATFLSSQAAAVQTVSAPLQTPAPPPTDVDPPAFVGTPALLPNPNPEVPLSAMIALETDEPTRVWLTFSNGPRVSEPYLADALLERVHPAVPVLGMRAGQSYEIELTVVDAAGNETVWPQNFAFNTPPLPAGFPALEITVSKPELMEPGVTMISPVESRANHSWLIMLDAEGEVVWFYQSLPERRVSDARRMDNGNLLIILNRDVVSEVDMLGNVIDEWKAVNITGPSTTATSVLTDSFHHEVIELPPAFEADFAVLSSELRTYPNYPADEVDQSQQVPEADVIGDVIVEFKRDGTIVNEWKLLDLLDPYRISYGSLGGFWNPHYGMMATEDWSHANAVVLDPVDDSYIVSARHQEALIKIDRQSGQVEWILGDPFNWTAPWDALHLAPEPGQEEFEWPYHQHAPQIHADGTIMIFDNGNGRAVAPNAELPETERYSRAVSFKVHPFAHTVEQVWSYHRQFPEEGFWYSSFLGDADRLSDTVLITDGGKTVPGTTSLRFARIVEVTYSPPIEKVFEVLIKDPEPFVPGAIGWTVYRSERLTTGVYPFDQ